jgi:hypothetical protein
MRQALWMSAPHPSFARAGWRRTVDAWAPLEVVCVSAERDAGQFTREMK